MDPWIAALAVIARSKATRQSQWRERRGCTWHYLYDFPSL